MNPSGELRAGSADRVHAKAEAELNDTTFDAFRSRPRRRALALVNLAAIVAVMLTGIMRIPWWSLAAVGVSFAVAMVLRRVVRAMADLPDELIDERIEQTRDRAHRSAYAIYAGLTTLAAAVATLVATAGDRGLVMKPDHASALLWGALFLWITLPSMILAWKETRI